MISIIAHNSVAKTCDVKWYKCPTAAIFEGRVAGARVAFEPFAGPWDVLHVPTEAIGALLLASSKGGGSLYGKQAAVSAVDIDWPLVELEEGVHATVGVPTIAGGVAPDHLTLNGEKLDALTLEGGKVKPVAAAQVDGERGRFDVK